MVVDIVGVVLVGEPRVRVRGVDGKITALTQPPHDVAVPRAVAVVDLDHPVLMSDRQDQVAVRGRQGHGVHVQPIDRRKAGDHGRRPPAARLRNLAQDRPAVHVQMVEGVPRPLHLQVGVEHDDHLTDVIGGDAVDGDGALGIREHDQGPVGQPLDVVVEAVDSLEAHGGKLGVHRREVRLADGVAGQVDLPQDVLLAHGGTARVAQADHRAPRQQGRGGHDVDPQPRLLDVVIPLHAAREVGGDRVRVAARVPR